MIPAPKYVGQSGTCDEMLHLRLFTMSSVHKSARLNMPKWLTFTSIFIRLPAHLSNKCISISKHEHSMVIHIASLMRVNLHNTGKYLHKHILYKYWQINNPFQLSNNKVTAPTSEMKVGHTSSAEAPMISYIYKRVREGVTSRTLFWVHVYIQNVFTFQIG